LGVGSGHPDAGADAQAVALALQGPGRA